MSSLTINKVYHKLLVKLIRNGTEQYNTRTKSKILMLPGGYSFKLSLESGRLPVPGNRKYAPYMAAAELAWQFMGTKDTTFINHQAPTLWRKFVQDDNILHTAAGWRWIKAFGRNQIALMLKTLKANSSDRQIYISNWDPGVDGLGNDTVPNTPCILGFTVSICYKEVYMSVFIRSSDVLLGLPYDIMVYSLLLDTIAASLDCKPGSIQFTLAHPHIYTTHYKYLFPCIFPIDQCLKEIKNRSGANDAEFYEFDKDMCFDELASNIWIDNCEPFLPSWSVNEIGSKPVDYITLVKRIASRVNQHAWQPKLKLVV